MRSTRTLVQLAFLALTVIGVFVWRGNAERWCPFGGIEGIYGYVTEGSLPCSLAVSNLILGGAVLALTLLLRRAFCGYACPIGALSEWLGRGAKRLGGGPAVVPRTLDRGLSLLKYPILVVILVFTWRQSELVFRGYDPCYALLSRHGEDITFWAYVVSGAVVVGSLLVSVPFCRWLCPLAAVLNPLSRIGLSRVVRDEGTCVECAACTEACPMAIPVDVVEVVRHARCTSCLDCVDACPERDGGTLSWRPFPGARGATRLAVVIVLLVVLAGGVVASVAFPLPSFVWRREAAAATTETVELSVEGVTCRGSALDLVYFLTRDDDLELPGHLVLEAWPGPDPARVAVTFDPESVDADAVRRALTEPCYDSDADVWQDSPFRIVGYDPLALPSGD